MKRRPFIKNILRAATVTAIAPQLSLSQSLASEKNSKKLGIALVGLGTYSTDQLAPALLETKLCYLSAIVTGTKEKEQQWIEKYGIKKENVYTYKNFDRIIDNDEIDIVYVVLPNSMHAEYTIRAAKAGKHVICEKPMATSVSDCKKMITACKKANKKLSIGYRLHFDPFNDNMMRLGQSKFYGNKMTVATEFSFNVSDINHWWRANKKLAGGGALMDLGIYCLQASIYTFGELPLTLWGKDTTKPDSIFNEVEGSIEWEMTFPSGKAYCKTSYESPFKSHLILNTEKGKLELSPSFTYDGIKGTTPDGEMELKNVNQQALQMDTFAQNILQDTSSIVPGEMGLRDNYIIEKIYESAANHSAVVNLNDIPNILDLRIN
ncbi:Gfo/Idh/MocA family protein [Winogradskyella flava]|uniref:Gfo/Idh/MocA family oxidoreductase n=1 Tax=Winogradskyella flava TaxID=1884876 RepID=A0A842IS23_9FLAO|nr:Gfo/Idh/MocA family oxidoreductase [Winogradskyella flava]MBC2845555.1 Gfo/Idh/MocA family oxidoreductase [Winogradskyella flava]